MPVSFTPDADLLSRTAARLRAAGCVFAEEEARLLISAASSPACLDTLVVRRVAGEPLEHVAGWADFCGLRIAVDPGVFVPRRRTEFLVRQAAHLAREAGAGATGEPPVVVDLCCGCGAIGFALAAALGGGRLHAVDIDPAAVACAHRNAGVFGGHVYQGDLYQPLPGTLRGRVLIVAANVPYVPSAEIRLLPAEARDHEPRRALDGGPDGLDVLRRAAAQAPGWLAPGGFLITETSERQAGAATGVLAGAGLTPHTAACPCSGATVVTGTNPV
jgi:release factor glutamine methyltransferase